MKADDAYALMPLLTSVLADGDYRRAWEMVYKVDVAPPVKGKPRRLKPEAPDEWLITELRNICESTPAKLQHLPEKTLWLFRLPVALALLTGRSRDLRQIPAGIDTGCHLNYDGVASAISRNAYRLRAVSDIGQHAEDFPVFQICSTVDDRMCEYCRSMHGRLFWVNQVDMVPPFDACTCPTGCRCMGVKTTTFRLGRKAELLKCPACAGVIVVNPDTDKTECRSCGQPVALT